MSGALGEMNRHAAGKQAGGADQHQRQMKHLRGRGSLSFVSRRNTIYVVISVLKNATSDSKNASMPTLSGLAERHGGVAVRRAASR